MVDKPVLTLHFITDPLLGIKTANSVAKIEMAKAFCKQSQVKKLYFHNMLESKKKLQTLHLSDISEKLILKPLFFKKYKEKVLHGRSFWSFCYKLFFASPIISLRAFFVALTVKKTDRVYIRGLESLFGFYFGSLVTNAKYVFELHNYTFRTNKITDFFYRRIMKRAAFIVTVSEYTKRNWVENGIAETKITILPSGVSMEDFDSINKNKNQLRKELGIGNDEKIITYTGALYEDKGIEELLYCAANCADCLFLFIGGVEEHIEKYKSYIRSQFNRQLSNVIFKGYINHNTIPLYLKASDLLVAPYPQKGYTVYHLSSIKLIEYMTSKVPVVTSDLPSTRTLVSEDEITFFQADNPNNLLEKIKLVFNNYEQAEAKALKAYERAKNLTWDKRAEQIISLLKN